VGPGLLAIVAALAASAGPAPAPAAPPPAQPRQGAAPAAQRRPVEFTPVPQMEAVHANNPHDHEGKPLCQRCHLRGQPGVAGDPIALCSQCHDASRMRHPFGIVQPEPPADLPLDASGRIVCHTCHDPHDVKKQRSGLRLAYMDLCKRCHAGHEPRGAHPAAEGDAAAERPSEHQK
jgi:predicted CXXCH cytochrome family protein